MAESRWSFVKVIAGARFTGKSHLINKLIEQEGYNRCIVFDPNEEHDLRCAERGFEGVEEFMDQLYQKVVIEKIYKNSPHTVVVEESTAYFRDKQTKHSQTERMLMRNRHYGLNIIFVFHSLRSIPIWMMEYTDEFYQFKTLEETASITGRFREHPQIPENHAYFHKMSVAESQGKFFVIKR